MLNIGIIGYAVPFPVAAALIAVLFIRAGHSPAAAQNLQERGG